MLTSLDIHGENNLFTLGSIYKLNIPGDHPINKLNIGLFDRFGYSIYPYVGFESIHWIAGITYDINNTNQKKYNYQFPMAMMTESLAKEIGKRRGIPETYLININESPAVVSSSMFDEFSKETEKIKKTKTAQIINKYERIPA